MNSITKGKIMSKNKEQTAKIGFGCYSPCILVFIVFLILKLTNTIDWSWLWITSPLWIPWSVVVLIIAILVCISIIAIPFVIAFIVFALILQFIMERNSL